MDLHFSDPQLAQSLLQKINLQLQRIGPVKLMHLCGSHELAINRQGLRSLLPKDLQVIAGPGCPVCVCPARKIDEAIELALHQGVTLFCFGDLLKVPGSQQSLAWAKSQGAEVRLAYSPLDAVRWAMEHSQREVVFFSVGFETTAAGVAQMVRAGLPKNFSLLCAHRYMPPATQAMLQMPEHRLQALLLPGHACMVTGLPPYEFLIQEFQMPAVVTGFEPLDLLIGVEQALEMVETGKPAVKNAYRRAVRDQGNEVAMAAMMEVFQLENGPWRGMGSIPGSALELREPYAGWDAIKKFQPQPLYPEQAHPPGCICHRILMGLAQPQSCGHFGGRCTPSNPLGPCMVSVEGTCASAFLYPATIKPS